MDKLPVRATVSEIRALSKAYLDEKDHLMCPNCGEYLQKPLGFSAIVEHDPLRLLGLPTTCALRKGEENDG